MDREATGLRRIPGIGTATERTLREAGVRTLEDLAGRPADELARITGKSQRAVQEWQAQARELAGVEKQGPIEPDRQRSETFTVEVLLNEDRSVRYVRVEHVYTQERHAREDRDETTSWSDWPSAERELTRFLREHAGLATQAVQRQPAAEEQEAPPVELQAVTEEPTPPPSPAVTESAPAGHHIRQLATMPSLASPGGVMPNEATPFTLRLPVTLPQLGLAPEDPLDYQATVVAKRLGQPVRLLVGEARGTAEGDSNGRFDVLLTCEGLPAGTYRLETVLRLGGAGRSVVALLENALIEVRPAPSSLPAPDQATVVPLR
jgi:hypothetical protein